MMARESVDGRTCIQQDAPFFVELPPDAICYVSILPGL